MPLFQKSVLKKHLQELHVPEIDSAYKKFTDYFHNSAIQKNIRESKEEQFQEGFLRELFGTIMGYVLNPNPNYNLTTELKNTTNSKKADGAILIDGKAIAVIELKGTDTTDLNKIEVQAFGYKNNQAECNYVITSNFEKLRFYIDNTIDFEEFNLFTLTRDQFNLLYLCLSYDNIKNNIPKRLKAESVSQEDQITKKLYKDYSEFKRALYNNLVELNPEFDKLLLFKKTQKLLDRFLFIFFAEDTNLLPTNLIFRINKEWKNLQEMRIPVSLYDRYLVYFNDLNHGAKVTLPAFGKKTGEAITAEFEIFAYNGGLFQPDDVLDNVKIDDTVLHTYSEKLSHYDFDSDVDVNILGHIFENSLNEIDEIKSEIEGTTVEKTKTKRKKDGVFYTPKYITKYIVDNTVGKLCTEKKAELKLVDEDYTNDKKLQTKTKKALLDKLAEYRAWLLQLTICDPACGSGAFLNQALEFLIAEHRYVDELQAKLMGDALILSDIETSILENNIYGVDLNDESVEIAKLSLWLRTAQKGRKLNSLNKNIKCGNSLIDDPAVAGEKAFSWEKEFPEVFAEKVSTDGTLLKSGGFDVVIGNPPYGVNITDGKEFFKINYSSTEGPFELYKFFIERSLLIIKPNGVLGFITPDTWINLSYFKKLRNIVFTQYNILECSESLHNIFSDAVVDTCIFIIRNNLKQKSSFDIINSSLTQKLEGEIRKLEDDFQMNFKPVSSIIKKLNNCKINLGSQTEIWRGMSAYGAKNPERPYNSFQKETDDHRKLLNGGDIGKYLIKWNGEYIKYGKWLHRPRPEYIYDNPKILVQRIRNPKLKNRIVAVYDDKGFISSDGLSNILTLTKSKFHLKTILGIINSKLINYWFSYHYFDVNIKPEQMRQIPLPNTTQLLEKLNHLVEKQLSLHIENTEFTHQFNIYIVNSIQSDLTSKLQTWYQLSYVDFIKELNKAIKASGGTPLTKKDEFEWMELFEENKQKALELKAQIDQTDKEIDAMVYELYGLSEEEIRIVEGR
jgi:hypothetical protein